MSHTIECPWCRKGKVIVEGSGDVTVSWRCHECGRFSLLDAKTQTAKPSIAYRTNLCTRQGVLRRTRG